MTWFLILLALLLLPVICLSLTSAGRQLMAALLRLGWTILKLCVEFLPHLPAVLSQIWRLIREAAAQRRDVRKKMKIASGLERQILKIFHEHKLPGKAALRGRNPLEFEAVLKGIFLMEDPDLSVLQRGSRIGLRHTIVVVPDIRQRTDLYGLVTPGDGSNLHRKSPMVHADLLDLAMSEFTGSAVRGVRFRIQTGSAHDHIAAIKAVGDWLRSCDEKDPQVRAALEKYGF